MRPSASDTVARYAVERSTHQVDDQTVHAVARAFVDTVGVAVAGANHPVVEMVRTVLGEPRGTATDWNTGAPHRSDDAAFINAVSGHILDFDDVTSPLRGHPSVVLVPALVALAEEEGATGGQVSAAYEIGFEVICRLSRPLIETHYVDGWHSTATIGLIGGAVAASQLLGLDAERTRDAIGIAVASAAGTRQNFGSLTKCYQAGNAAAAAVRAVRLAQAGMDASPGAIDGDLGGFVGLYTRAAADALEDELATIGDPPGELVTSGIEVKKYPLCYATHRTLDGLLDLRAEHALTLGDVARVEVRTNNGGLVPLIHARPQTGLEGKFSMQFAVAAALRFGSVRLATFTDAVVQSPDIQQFLPKVEPGEADGPMFPRWAELQVELADGTVLSRRVERLRGSAEAPLTEDELTDKVADCFDFGGSPADAAAFVDAALNWRSTPVCEVLASIRR